MPRKPKNTTTQPFSRERVLEALAQTPTATKRDLSRVLNVHGNERIALKRILKELERDGLLKRGERRTFVPPGALPEVTVVEITGQDMDGELLARPVKWDSEREPPRICVQPGREEGGKIGIGDRVLARLIEEDGGFEAKVIKKLGQSAHKVLGVYQKTERGGRIAPIDRRSRTEFIVEQRDSGNAAHNELVLAEPLAGRAAGLPRARVAERLGSMSEPKAVSMIAIHAHGIPTEFPDEVIEQAKAAQPVDPRGRTDLRRIPLVTIDPEDARDHDDAVWAGPDDDPKNQGGHVVIVAIADVAHYVTPGSALDREAYKRGNSCYFPDRVVPMLPEELSADLCSLREGVDRACLAVRMVFDKNGNKRHHEFIRGIMRSAARLTYAQAQRGFEGNPDEDKREIAKAALEPLWKAYQTVLIARKERDPLDLDLPERRIIIGENGKVASIAYRERLESMKLIEEFMIQANVAAAETLEKARVPLIYRIHETPSKEKLASFADFLHTLGIPFAKGQVIKPAAFNKMLARVKGGPHESVMNDVVLRTQAQAVYSPDNVGHFGLNLQRYAHFTSPIRRYADLVVHRALVRAGKFGNDGLTDKEIGRLKEIADHISICERRAMAAERDSTDRYVAAFMADRIGANFSGRITGVTRFGLFIRLTDTGAEGLLPVRDLGTEFYKHDEKRHALVGEFSRTVYRLGDDIGVRLMEAAPLTGGLRFELAVASKYASRERLERDRKEAGLPPKKKRTAPKISKYGKNRGWRT